VKREKKKKKNEINFLRLFVSLQSLSNVWKGVLELAEEKCIKTHKKRRNPHSNF